MIRKKLFSMIELLVGMAVLAIMMTFLINAFTSAEELASSGNKSMTIFERSNMSLDFMAADLRQLVVNDNPRTELGFTYGDVAPGESTFVEFTGRQFFTATPGLRQLLRYDYNKATGTLSRSVDGGTVETLMEGISSFTLEYYDEKDVALHDVDASYSGSNFSFSFIPNYCQVTITLDHGAASGSELTQRTFMRRVYFQ